MKFILNRFNYSLSSILFLLLFSPHLSISALVIPLSSPRPRSCCDQSDYQEFSGSLSAEDEYLPIRRRTTKLSMTRHDPQPHRPNPRAWMDQARRRDSFSSRHGTQMLTLYIIMFVSCFTEFLAGIMNWKELKRWTTLKKFNNEREDHLISYFNTYGSNDEFCAFSKPMTYSNCPIHIQLRPKVFFTWQCCSISPAEVSQSNYQ